MAGSTIQSKISIDITAGAKLSGDAKTEFDTLRRSLLDTGNSAKDVESILLKMKDILDQNTASLNGVTAASDQLKNGLDGIASSGKLAAGATGELKDGLASANSGLTSSGGLLDSMSKQRVAFTDIGRLITGQGFSLRSLSANFALFGPAVVIGAAAIGFLGEQLVKYIKNSDDAALATKEFTDQVGKSLSADIGQVDILTATIKDNNTSQEERKKAIQDLIDQHPNYFSNLQEEDGVTKNLETDIKKYVAALNDEAKAKAAVALITKYSQEQLEDQVKLQEKIAASDKLSFDSPEAKQNFVQYLTNEADVKVKELQTKIDTVIKFGVQANQDLTKLGGDTGADKKGSNDNSLQEQKTYIAESQKILEDAEEKEITSENIKYEKIKADLIKFGHDTEDLTTVHEQNITDIRTKFANERQDKLNKLLQDLQKEQAKAQAEGEAKLGQALSSYLQKGEEIGKTEQQKKVDAENATYAKLIDEAMLYGRTTEDLEVAHQEHLAAIKKEYDDKANAKDKKAREKELTTGSEHANSIAGKERTKYTQQLSQLDAYQKAVDTSYKKGEITLAQYNSDNDNLAKARQQIRNNEIKDYATYAGDVGQSLTSIAQAFGENTQTGKDIAIAGAIISTISGAVKAYDSLAAIPIVGPALGIAAASAALATGYANVKKIEAVTITGQSSGASTSTDTGGGAVSSYNAPQIPTAVNSTNLSGQSIQQIQSINQQSAPVRAFVTENDITSTVNRVAGYRNASSLGPSTNNPH